MFFKGRTDSTDFFLSKNHADVLLSRTDSTDDTDFFSDEKPCGRFIKVAQISQITQIFFFRKTMRMIFCGASPIRLANQNL